MTLTDWHDYLSAAQTFWLAVPGSYPTYFAHVPNICLQVQLLNCILAFCPGMIRIFYFSYGQDVVQASTSRFDRRPNKNSPGFLLHKDLGVAHIVSRITVTCPTPD